MPLLPLLRRLLAVVMVLGLGACSAPGDDAAETPPPLTGRDLGADNFLQFLNRQPTLAAGSHTLVAATAAAGASGRYRLVVRFDDGREQAFDGAWSASSGPGLGAGNPRHVVQMDRPGGLTATLESGEADAVLILLDAGGGETARDDNSAGGRNARLAMARSATDDTRYARAYYATIDPLGQRRTLTDWQRVNGFDAGEDAHVVFRDTRDLGYGRNMHFRRNADGRFAAYVGNYQILTPGQAYGPLTLDAALDELDDFHIGTNAIEYGPVDSDGNGAPDDVTGDGLVTTADYFPQFYTFSPNPPFQRLEAVDMDGFGAKGMPIPCIVCHGGRADPLLPDGRFPRNGDTLSRVQPIDVDTVGLSATRPGFTRAELEDDFKAINRAAYDSYAPHLVARPGQWNGAMARELIEGWYGGPGLPAARFEDNYVPEGWRPDPTDGFPPQGSDVLYRELLSGNCRTCHLLRGTQDNSEIDFSSYQKFIGHAGEIVPLVYDQGRMPLALVPYFNLFDAPGLPDRLASFLPAFDRVDAQGRAMRPGRPIANAGPDRRGPSPLAVNGIASRQAEGFSWRIVSMPTGATASLDAPRAVRPRLMANRDGVYVLELVVTRGTQSSAADTVTVVIDSAMARPPASLRFETDIKPILQGGITNCVQCHAADNTQGVLPPVFYTDPAAGENRDLYAEVRARVNFNDPTESPLLTKPQGRHHNGGTISGFDFTADRSRYDLVLDWILEGAPR